MKERFLWVGIGVVLLSWIGNFLYFQSKQLEQPIFLDHYYQRAYDEEGTQLSFYYLTNKQHPLDILDVKINGVKVYPVEHRGLMMWQNGQQQVQYEREFRHQYLKKVTLNFPVRELDQSRDLWAFEKMNVTFSDGSKMTADIGSVILHDSFTNSNSNVFEFRSGTSSNQHRESKSLVTTETIRIDNIGFPFGDELVKDIAVKVDIDQEKLKELEVLKQNGNPPPWYKEEFDESWENVPGIVLQHNMFPLELEQGEWLRLFMHFNPERTSYLNFGIEVKGVTADGEPFVTYTLIHDYPYIDQDDVNQITADQ